MTLISRCKQGHHDHDLEVEQLALEHCLLVQRADVACEDALIAVLAFPV